MGRRRRSREHALQMLFQIDLTGVAPDDVFRVFWGGRGVAEEDREFAERLVLGVHASITDLDGRIGASAEHWRIERMAVVDRNVLRMAVYELLRAEDAPAAVVIDEAVEVAKKFGSAESGSFINGILDAVRIRLERGEIDCRNGSE